MALNVYGYAPLTKKMMYNNRLIGSFHIKVVSQLYHYRYRFYRPIAEPLKKCTISKLSRLLIKLQSSQTYQKNAKHQLIWGG